MLLRALGAVGILAAPRQNLSGPVEEGAVGFAFGFVRRGHQSGLVGDHRLLADLSAEARRERQAGGLRATRGQTAKA